MKPEKKKILPMINDYRGGHKTINWIRGYNQSCDDWEDYLPSKIQIHAKISDFRSRFNPEEWKLIRVKWFKIEEDLAKAIHQRISK